MIGSAQNYNERKEALDQARRQEEPSPVNNEHVYAREDRHPESRQNAANAAVSMAKKVSPLGFFLLLKEVNLIKDMPFFAAIIFALLKDLLDIAFSVTVVIPFIFSVLFSIFLVMMIILAGSGGKIKTGKFIWKGLTIIGGGLTDSLANIAPMAIFTTLIIYLMTLKERADAKNSK